MCIQVSIYNGIRKCLFTLVKEVFFIGKNSEVKMCYNWRGNGRMLSVNLFYFSIDINNICAIIYTNLDSMEKYTPAADFNSVDLTHVEIRSAAGFCFKD